MNTERLAKALAAKSLTEMAMQGFARAALPQSFELAQEDLQSHCRDIAEALADDDWLPIDVLLPLETSVQLYRFDENDRTFPHHYGHGWFQAEDTPEPWTHWRRNMPPRGAI